MNDNILLFIKIFVLFILIDMIWIQLFAKNKYKKMIKDIQKEELSLKIFPAILVYVFMTLLLLIFRNNNLINIFLLGFLSYGIYDMTSASVLNKFDIKFGLLDMIWGGILFSIVNKLI
jgi:uncharacterized membrane protein